MSMCRVRAGFAVALLSSFALLPCVGADRAEAQPRYGGYPPKYCVRAYDGDMECFYYDLQQCWAAARGTGGDCAINPRFRGYPDPAAARWKKVYR